MVGMAGFEPAISRTQTERLTGLAYIPKVWGGTLSASSLTHTGEHNHSPD